MVKDLRSVYRVRAIIKGQSVFSCAMEGGRSVLGVAFVGTCVVSIFRIVEVGVGRDRGQKYSRGNEFFHGVSLGQNPHSLRLFEEVTDCPNSGQFMVRVTFHVGFIQIKRIRDFPMRFL